MDAGDLLEVLILSRQLPIEVVKMVVDLDFFPKGKACQTLESIAVA